MSNSQHRIECALCDRIAALDIIQSNCQFIAGCDGFHGVSRRYLPKTENRIYEKNCPFGWLGVLSETPPIADITCANDA